MNPQIIWSIVLTIATVLYTFVTVLMFIETRKTRLQKTTPLVIAYLQSTEDHNTIMLSVKNIGEGCAKDVKLNIIEDYHLYERNDCLLSKEPIFQDGISIFPPQYELHYYLNNWQNLSPKSRDSVELQVTYRNLKGNLIEEKPIKLVLNQISQMYSTPPETNIGQIAYYLKDIDKKMAKISNKNTNA